MITFLPVFAMAQGFGNILETPILLGMERTEVEGTLGAPLVSFAQEFSKKPAQNHASFSTVSYSFYQVPAWQESYPQYLLAIFLDGYVIRLINFYREPAYEVVAWKISEDKNFLRGKKGGWEYYQDKDHSQYFIMEKFQKNLTGDSLLNQEIKGQIVDVLDKDTRYYLVMHHDEDLFGLLHQSLEDLNFLTTLFEKLLSNKRSPNIPSPEKGTPIPPPGTQDIPAPSVPNGEEVFPDEMTPVDPNLFE
ncbi:MAG: hypothetical protein ACRCVN_04490 [Spirochaetia bacterium]